MLNLKKMNKGKSKLQKRLPDEPMTLDQFVVWTGASPLKHIRLIGEYAKEVGQDCQTVEQWNIFLKRNLRPAMALVPFKEEQIQKAMERLHEADWLTKWGLETVLKFLIK